MSYEKTKLMNLEDGQTLLGAIDGKMSDLKSAIQQTKADVITVNDTASSAIKTFPDGADDQPMAVQIAIEPVQQGEGDPSPTNVRPITGWTGANVTRTGKNLLAKPFVYFNAVSHTKANSFFLKKGSYKLIFDDSSATSLRLCVYLCDANGNSLSASKYTPANGMNWQANNLQWIQGANTTSKIITCNIIEDCYVRLFFAVGDTTASTTFTNVRLVDDTQGREYEPFGQVYPITFPSEAGTVYGGTLTVNKDGTGTLMVNMVCITLTGEEDWAETTSEYVYNVGNFLKGHKKTNILQSDKYRTTNTSAASSMPDFSIKSNNSNAQTAQKLYIKDTRYSTVEEFVNAVAGTQVMYELAEPVPYELTCDQVKTLLGLNNLWADTGDILSVDYSADTKLYVDQITGKLTASQRLMELIITTNREDSMTATKAYSAGDLLIVSGTLYKASTSIANGATLTVGTNVTATTVASELASLA